MTLQQHPEIPSDPELRASLAAMQRAAVEARRVAIQTGTAIVIVRNGVRVRVPAETLRAEIASSS